jgi:lysophospholipase L1-like esterase
VRPQLDHLLRTYLSTCESGGVNDRCVLFFGDSFVSGAGDPEALGWVGRVVAASWRAHLPLTAYNLGVRGETTPQVAARLRAEALPRLIPDADNVAVVAVGANDVSLRENGTQEVSTEASLGALDRIFDDAARLDMRVWVIGPGPSGIADHDARSRQLDHLFEGLTEQRGGRHRSVLDDLLASDTWAREARAGDGVHPGAGGYGDLAELVLRAGWLDWLRGSA